MKKSAKWILLSTTMLFLAACTADEAQENSNDALPANSANEDGNVEFNSSERDASSTLIVYYSLPEAGGVDAVAGSSRVVNDGEVVGNTQQVAYWAEEQTGADLFQIETVEEYPGDHDELVEQGTEEHENDSRPEIADYIDNIDDYDTILFGHPIWLADLPSPVYSFLEDIDFSGKTIIPFSTHGGNAVTDTKETIADLQPQAEVEIDNGLTISRDDVPEARQEVNDWLTQIGFE